MKKLTLSQLLNLATVIPAFFLALSAYLLVAVLQIGTMAFLLTSVLFVMAFLGLFVINSIISMTINSLE